MAFTLSALTERMACLRVVMELQAHPRHLPLDERSAWRKYSGDLQSVWHSALSVWTLSHVQSELKRRSREKLKTIFEHEK